MSCESFLYVSRARLALALSMARSRRRPPRLYSSKIHEWRHMPSPWLWLAGSPSARPGINNNAGWPPIGFRSNRNPLSDRCRESAGAGRRRSPPALPFLFHSRVCLPACLVNLTESAMPRCVVAACLLLLLLDRYCILYSGPASPPASCCSIAYCILCSGP